MSREVRGCSGCSCLEGLSAALPGSKIAPEEANTSATTSKASATVSVSAEA